MSSQLPVMAVFLISPITAVGISILACDPDPDPIDLSSEVAAEVFVAPDAPSSDLRVAAAPIP